MPADRPPALTYLRVSTERQAGEQVTSLADQQKAIAALATKLGAAIVETFRDEGVSGATTEKRPGFTALLAHCMSHPQPRVAPGFVLALNDSRLGRWEDPEEAAAVRVQLRKAGWLVRLCESDDVEDPTFRSIIRALGSAQASEYRKAIIRNAQRGRQGAAALGFWATREPIGFRRAVVHPAGRERVLETGQRKAPDEKVTLVLGPAVEVAALREAFASFADGRRSLAGVAAYLTQQIPYRRWGRSTTRQVMANEIYAGTMVTGRRRGELNRQGKWRTDPATWQRSPDAFPALVDRETFDQAQRRLASYHVTPRAGWTDYRVSGLVMCATCGQPLVGGGANGHYRDGQKVRFYRCRGSVNRRCDGRLTSVSQHLLEPALIGAIAKELRHPTVRAAILKATEAVTAPKDDKAARKALLAEIQRAEARRERLVLAVADGTMTSEEARTALDTTRQAIARLQATSDASESTPRDIGALRSQREQLSRLALDFETVASLANGTQLRDVLAPWLASATFDKTTRELRLGVRTVPLSLLTSYSHRRTGAGSPGRCRAHRR